MTYEALLNGHETTATKSGGKWIVGGDFPQKSDQILICLNNKDTDREAWYSLRGCRLIFQDYR